MSSRISFASSEIFGMVLSLDPMPGRTLAAVPDATCLTCHDEVLDRVVAPSGLRILHRQCAVGRSCSDCHSGAAHGSETSWLRVAEMGQCLECHAVNGLSDCDTCHAAKSENERLASGTWAITHGAHWRSTHGMGDLATCGACHQPTYCIDCHGIPMPHPEGYGSAHGSDAKADRQVCRNCHASGICDDCHGVEMPHPAGFTPRHSALATTEGRAICERCHPAEDCDECHVKHVHPGGAISAPGGSR